jgi:hypothetical protein
MDIIEAGLIRNFVIMYVSEKYDLEIDPIQDDPYEILIHKFHESLYLLFKISEDKEIKINSYIEMCKRSKLDINLFNIIYDFWLGENIEQTVLEDMLSTYNQTISRLPQGIMDIWIQTNFPTTGRFLKTLRDAQTLLFIEIHTRGTKNSKTPYTDFFNLSTSLCVLPDKFVIENDPYRDFACLQFFSDSVPFTNSKPQEIPDQPEKTIEDYYSNLSTKTNEHIYKEMQDRDGTNFISILFDIHKFKLIFGFPDEIAEQFIMFPLDCFHPLLDRIIDSDCIIESSPDKIITELTQINFGFKLAYHKIKSCPNYEKLPILYPKSFAKSATAFLAKKLFWNTSKPIHNLYDIYYRNASTIIDTFTNLLQ